MQYTDETYAQQLETPAEPTPTSETVELLPSGEPLMPINEFTEESGHALDSFKKNMLLFNKALNDFSGSKKQLLNAWANSALAPLNQTPLQWSYPDQKKMCEIFDEVNSAKFILMVHGLADVGILTLHKPLMMATAATPSEKQLRDQMNKLTSGPVLDLGTRELPPADSL